ncbi:dephospho-CoA kinase [Companilactobacillus furfuricola]|uniref:dephospho-CoA kinase n=1 Tax=Companilactobacillus furfuricola TaxID=1462575 RepID=UPI000F7764C6|nr:dephospho-CoA kinase [Companilactobacillus furfuricola]
MSKIYGLTGGIAAGKTTILNIFQKLGCKIYDADQVARIVVEPGTTGLRQITKQFGKSILLSDGTLDRKKLGRIVFSDRRQLKLLTGITGPLIRKKILKMIDEAKNDQSQQTYIFEIQLLFESHYQEYFDATIAVYVDHEIQLKRLIKRNNITKQAAEDKINAQMSMEQKRELADYWIDNSQTIDDLEKQIKLLLKQL